MSWKPIVVGVDATLEASLAAAAGARLAEVAHTSCHFIHVVREDPPPAYARETIRHALWGSVPTPLLDQLLVRSGRAPVALRQAAAELDAGLIVIGGRHHTAAGELLRRSTASHLARTAEVPVLVTRSDALPHRVLVAVDVSAAARVTLEAAQQWAAVCGAELRVVSVVELLPVNAEMPFGQTDPGFYSGYYDRAKAAIEREIWPLVTRVDAQTVLRFGRTLETLVHEAQEWPADLLVVGTHGKGWVERALLGSVTERLLHLFPTSLLIVPAHAALLAEEGVHSRSP